MPVNNESRRPTVEEIYRRLAAHLDHYADGFPPSATGADQRLLQRLFTPAEAELATHLTLDREPAWVIAERARLPPGEVSQQLAEMARKGLILAIHPESGPALFQAVPFVVGIYEFQGNDLNEELLHDLDDYWSTRKERPPAQTIPQMRTIPVGKSLEFHPEALPYEQINELIKAHDRFAVADCICRRIAKLTGNGCNAPEESCLMFGDWADYYAHTGRGRAISRSEVMEILARADAANLVLQPSNSEEIAFLCCCCGCCCGALADLKRHPKPAAVVASHFIAALEAEICQGCWTCLERCQMAALAVQGDRVALDLDRCIGCGLCVSTCPSGALTLVRKPDSHQTQVPVDLAATWRTIGEARAQAQ
jgi:electron transport complex protein RnfB